MTRRARAVQAVPVHAEYGWSAEGKSPEEIAGDIRQTRYRLEADVRAFKRKIAQIKWPAVGAAGLAALLLLIKRLRR